jgi:hypothetical protein
MASTLDEIAAAHGWSREIPPRFDWASVVYRRDGQSLSVRHQNGRLIGLVFNTPAYTPITRNKAAEAVRILSSERLAST